MNFPYNIFMLPTMEKESVSADHNHPDNQQSGQQSNRNIPARITINTNLCSSLLKTLTRINHPAPLLFVNHHTASQESQLRLVPPRPTLSVPLCPCGVFQINLGFPVAGRKPKPFLMPSSVKCLVVTQTPYTFTEGDKLRFSEKGNGVKG